MQEVQRDLEQKRLALEHLQAEMENLKQKNEVNHVVNNSDEQSQEIQKLQETIANLRNQLAEYQATVEQAKTIQAETAQLKASFQATLEMLKHNQATFAEEKWKRQKGMQSQYTLSVVICSNI